MMPSPDLVTFVGAWESCSLIPYPDAVGLPTIGYGHRIPSLDYPNLTQAEADEMLNDDLSATMRGLSMHVSADWGQIEADALTSLAFNCGVQAIANSHLLALFNEGLAGSAAMEFTRWNHANGEVLPGLTKRRAAEQQIFLNGDYSGRP